MPGPSVDFIMPTAYAPYGPVPASAPASITTEEVAMLGGFFSNPTAGILTLTVTDGSDQPIVPGYEIPPKGTYTLDTGGLSRFTGLKWGMDGAGGYGELAGYPTV